MKAIIVLFLLVFIACQPESDMHNKSNIFPHELTPVYKAELVNQLNSEPDETGFGQLIHLDMSEKGDFYITDVQSGNIHRYSPGGKEISVFSRPGSGPGEFLSMNLKLDNNHDQAGIYDPISSRLTILDSRLDTVIRSVSVESPAEHSIELLGFEENGVYYKGFLGYNLSNYEEPREKKVFFQEYKHSELNHLFSVPLAEWIPIVDEQSRSILLTYQPLGRRTTLSKQNDQFIYISNDGFGYSKYDLEGTRVFSDSLSQDFRPYTFTEKQLQLHMDQFHSGFPESEKQEVLKELQNVTDTKEAPLFQNSFIDTNNRIWFELYPELFRDESRWIVWDIESNEYFQVLFDEDQVRPQNSAGDTIIAFKKNQFDLETVRIYEF